MNILTLIGFIMLLLSILLCVGLLVVSLFNVVIPAFLGQVVVVGFLGGALLSAQSSIK